MDHIQDLSFRLARIERQYRMMRMLALLGAIIAGSFLVMGQVRREQPKGTALSPVPPPPQSVEDRITAKNIVLVDEKGTERASLVTDGNGSVFLVLFDAKGKARADLQVNNYGPSLNFYDADAKSRVIIGSTSAVGSHVENGGIVEKNPASSIVLFDRLGKLLWRAP